MKNKRKKIGIYEDLFGTSDNPTIIPFKSTIKNTKLYFFTIAFSAFLFAGHIQNPDITRELFFKCGGFSFDKTLNNTELLTQTNNILSLGTAFIFLGYFLFGSIVDYYGIFPCALLAHILCIFGYIFFLLIHVNIYLYYLGAISFGLSIAGVFISRSRFMEMFPENKNSVVMFLTWGMDFSLLLPVGLDIIGDNICSHKTLLTGFVILLSFIILHHCTILPFKLPSKIGRKYEVDEESSDNLLNSVKSIKNDENNDLVGIAGYRELPWYKKIISLPFVAFAGYFAFLSLIKIHYLLFYRKSVFTSMGEENIFSEKTVRLGVTILSLVSSASCLWGLYVDKYGLYSALLLQMFAIILSYLPITFNYSNMFPALISSAFGGVFTCYHTALTYTFVSGIFGYNNFGLIHGSTTIIAIIITSSVKYWQMFLNGPFINGNLLFLNKLLLYSSCLILVIIFFLKISSNKNK